MDQIIISRQRLDDTENLDPKCITSFEEKIFHFNLSECDPYIVVRNLQSRGYIIYCYLQFQQTLLHRKNVPMPMLNIGKPMYWPLCH